MSVMGTLSVEVGAERLPTDLHGVGVAAWRVIATDGDTVDSFAVLLVGRGGVTVPSVRLVSDGLGHDHSRLALSLMVHHGPRQDRWGMLLEVGGSMPGRSGVLATAAAVLHAADILEIDELIVPAAMLGHSNVAAAIDPGLVSPSSLLDATARERSLRAIERDADSDAAACRKGSASKRSGHLYPI